MSTNIFSDKKDPQNILEEVKKNIRLILITTRCVLGIHIFYQYVSTQTTGEIAKGGTFIEGTTSPITYLPYVSVDDQNKVYQNMIFEPCVEPVFTGTDITYSNTLCSVETEDYQQFTVTVPPEHYWSDEEPITIEDVYFTYNTILKENSWNREFLKSYKNLSIGVEGNALKIGFPTASIDNLILFTNFILPQHILANKDLEYYTNEFLSSPTTSGCGTVDQEGKDESSIVFDLTNCKEIPAKYYQAKYFSNEENLKNYLETSDLQLDSIYGTPLESEGYQKEYIIENKFATMFFNTTNEGMRIALRKRLASYFMIQFQDELPEESGIASDQFIYDAIIPKSQLDLAQLENDLKIKTISQTIVAQQEDLLGEETIEEEVLLDLPAELIVNQELNGKEFAIRESIDVFRLNLRLPENISKLSVTHNQGPEYFPTSFSEGSTNANYNVSEDFGNIFVGKNLYTITTYDKDGNAKRALITVHYKEIPKPTPIEKPVIDPQKIKENIANLNAQEEENKEELTIDNPLRITYFASKEEVQLINVLKKNLLKDNLLQYFIFDEIDDTNILEGKIESGEYDVVVRIINMGLRKDLSNIFISESSRVNPSNYTNEELSELSNKYFLTQETKKQSVKDRIDVVYGSNTPFVILGKVLGTYLKPQGEQSPYPKRMYVRGRRKNYLKNTNAGSVVKIDRKKAFSVRNFITFLQEL